MPQQESFITFLKGDKSSVETDYRDLLSVNMSGIARKMFGVDGYMLETPGLTSFATGFGVDRGGNWNERFGEHYRLSGEVFCRISQTGVVTSIQSGVLGGDQCSLPYSFETQGIVVDGKFYLYDPTNGFRQVTDPNVRTPVDGVWIDGYYCLTDGEFLYHTEIIAGTPIEDQINPLALATAEFSPDATVGVGRSVDNKWIAFNRYTTEFFENVGGETFAFARINGRSLNVGIVSKNAKAFLEDIWFFVGSRKYEALSVFGMGVGSADKIASREVEKILAKYADSQLAQSKMEVRQMDGYSYLIIHLPSEVLFFNYTLSKTVGIDQAWSILTTGVSGNQIWRGVNGIYDPRISSWIYGDKRGSNIGRLDNNSCEQYGEIQEWYLNTPFMSLETASIDELEVQTIPGFTATDDGTVFISATTNGVTYSMEQTIEYGQPSQYGQRFIARQLGYVSDWISFRLRGASRSRMVFSAAKIKYG